jgi:hypothetical protein
VKFTRRDILRKSCLKSRNFELVLRALGTWWVPIRGTFLVPFEEESKYLVSDYPEMHM